ncbi:hypothetical protein [Longimicrobium sp.]|uniref:hypothetical protein n=1 Tax=Longimicrobium sp. TaxID=2029185 RepID=UPI002BC140F5|nr:hypothetical protein [Longimicrobium sp.]HSU17849.1 hypothetical protein [Longimicrobium sp.]
MKKLRLDDLAVESFSPASAMRALRGTVAAREEEIDTTLHCPDSYGGTCWISCFETCPCTDGPACP